MTRRRKLWLAGGLLVAATAIVIWSLWDTSPYAFLNRFNPRRAVLDQRNRGLLSPSRIPLRFEESTTVLIFNESDAKAVRSALDDHFSKANGYIARSLDRLTAGYGNNWDKIQEYGRGSFPNWTSDLLQEGATAQFFHGPQATLIGHQAQHPDSMFEESLEAARLQRGCIVLIPRHPSWVENTVETVRGWLHL
jgi:hypothetical protein